MTKEEIIQAAQDWDGSGMATPAEEGAFVAGAEWMRDKMIEKAADWFQDYLFDVGYPDDWLRDSRVLVSGRDRFIKAMYDESK
jgi:hypothetical protein